MAVYTVSVQIIFPVSQEEASIKNTAIILARTAMVPVDQS